MAAMRNFLIHEYFGVDSDTIRETRAHPFAYFKGAATRNQPTITDVDAT